MDWVGAQLRWGICAVVMLGLAQSALADSPPDDVRSATVLKLKLKGQIPSRCGFDSAPPTSAELGSLSHGGSLQLGFTLDCNSAFRIRVSSAYGALMLGGDSAPAVRAVHGGLAISLDYALALNVMTDLGNIGDTCSSVALAGHGACSFFGAGAAQGLSSGNGVCLDQPGSLIISWQAPKQPLAAGTYKDVIKITVEARI